MSDRSEPAGSAREMLEDVKKEAGSVAGRVQAQASETTDAVKETAGKTAEEAKAQGAELLGQARERAESLAEDSKATGAEQASGFARAIRHAADDLEDSSPDLARHVRAAADSLAGISDALRERSAGQLFEDVSDFARRQPTIFFGVAAIAGFALVRFARSSTGGRGKPSRPTATTAPGWTRDGADEAPRPATMAAATLGGTAAHREGDAEPGQMPTSPSGSAPTPNSPTPSSPTSSSATATGQSGSVPNEKLESPL